MLEQDENTLTMQKELVVLNNEFDPYDIIQNHEQTLAQLVKAHNEVANLAEQLAESLVILNNKLDKIERFIVRNIDEIE